MKKAPPHMLAQLAMISGRIPKAPCRVVVTGGAGFIGSHVLRDLCQDGHPVLNLDDFSTGKTHRHDERAELVVADMADPSTFAAILGVFKPDVVVHLAGPSDARQSSVEPGHYYDSIINAALMLAEAGDVRTWGRRVVFASSCAVYGDGDGLVDESGPLCGASPYGAAKIAAEEILASACNSGLLHSCVSLRLFNVAGATEGHGKWPGLGDTRTNRIIPALLHAAKHGQTVKIADDGGPPVVRDFVHVADVAAAFCSAARQIAADHFKGYTPFNIGGGHANAIDLRGLAELVDGVAGSNIEIQTAPSHRADPRQVIADASAAGPLLGWKPRRNLDTILRSAHQFTEAKE